MPSPTRRTAGPAQRNVTLIDVARAAGVGKSTVSNVLNGSGRVGEAARARVLDMLLSAARRLEPLDADLAREAHLEALVAAVWAGDQGCPDGVREAAEAAYAAPPSPGPPRAVDVLLGALATRLTRDMQRLRRP